MEKKLEEGICEYYPHCRIKDMTVRDCTKPAYEDCETYQFWETDSALGIGAMVVPLQEEDKIDIGGD